jgi:hypothetical protein
MSESRRAASILAIPIALVLVLGTRPAWSADAPTLETCAAAIDRAAQALEGERVVLGHISRRLNIAAATLRTQRAQTGLGWGDLLIANYLSAETTLPFDRIVGELRAARSWESVIRSHGVDADHLLLDVRRSQEMVEQRAEDRAPPRIDMGTRSGSAAAGGGEGAGRGRGRRY